MKPVSVRRCVGDSTPAALDIKGRVVITPLKPARRLRLQNGAKGFQNEARFRALGYLGATSPNPRPFVAVHLAPVDADGMLLLRDRIEFIVPFKEYSPAYDGSVAEAMELIVTGCGSRKVGVKISPFPDRRVARP